MTDAVAAEIRHWTETGTTRDRAIGDGTAEVTPEVLIQTIITIPSCVRTTRRTRLRKGVIPRMRTRPETGTASGGRSARSRSTGGSDRTIEVSTDRTEARHRTTGTAGTIGGTLTIAGLSRPGWDEARRLRAHTPAPRRSAMTGIGTLKIASGEVASLRTTGTATGTNRNDATNIPRDAT